MRQNPRVRVVEPNYIVHASVAPTDPLYPGLWGLHNTGQSGGTPGDDIDAEHAWNVGTGSRAVKVAVIDLVDYSTPTWRRTSGPTGRDSGQRHRRHHNGLWTTCGGTSPTATTTRWTTRPRRMSRDDRGAGRERDRRRRGNWQVTIIPVSSSATAAAFFADAVTAIDYATLVGARVLNARGAAGPLAALPRRHQPRRGGGALFVAAAGTPPTTTTTSPPIPRPTMLPTSCRSRHHRNDTWRRSRITVTGVDLGAPGVSILSTADREVRHLQRHLDGRRTSQAWRPIVLSVAPDLTVPLLKQRLLLSTVPSRPAGITVTGGRLNAARALAGPDGAAPPRSPA